MCVGMLLSIHRYVHVNARAQGGQSLWISLELELQAVVNHLTGMLGLKSEPSARAIHGLN